MSNHCVESVRNFFKVAHPQRFKSAAQKKEDACELAKLRGCERFRTLSAKQPKKAASQKTFNAALADEFDTEI
jgi:hypothetical protein